MRFHADLHIHSKHSRATSRDCDLEHSRRAATPNKAPSAPMELF